ncbi:tetratricopeptide repeat protein [Pedobacter sp. CCM 8938]|uniref:Tetratricopeptide repeat protein n=2 Tax=Pedobacter fastidiosus TaxID=2765361 RepID=A0ABR7KVU1_9SPHI|nr:tetratricopeptide repeat protein [Pedobacter fastidiosus]MBC6112234.1 tetratricopeptide repeat protein [Pedobacter fastidiosus]
MTEDKILLTARYVEGDMDETERIGFEIRVQNELDLQQHLKDYNEIHQNLKIHLAPDQKNELLRDTLYAVNKQYFVEEARVASITPIINWMTGIAAVLLLGFLIWVPWRNNLYSVYAGNSAMSVTKRSAEKKTDLDQAAQLYNQKNFNAAKPLLEKQYMAEPENAIVAYYYGNTLVETSNVDDARAVLNNVYLGTSKFKYDAAYSIALSYLKNDRKAECKIWLQKIPAGTAHYKDAIELFNKL